MIHLKNISVIVGKGTALENTVLRNINLHIEKNDFVTIIGSNGAGKSTLLGLIAGFATPSRGKILVDKEDVTSQPIEKRAEWIGYVYQDPRLGTCDTLTIEENLAFAYYRGKQRSLAFALNQSLKKHFQSVLVELDTGLENRLSERVALLSGGQRQVLSLVMATLQPPKILLLDEHTAALDPKTAKIILALTQRIVNQHKLTTLMVTHNMIHALEMGNRTLLMREGKVIHDLSEANRRGLTPAELIDYL